MATLFLRPSFGSSIYPQRIGTIDAIPNFRRDYFASTISLTAPLSLSGEARKVVFGKVAEEEKQKNDALTIMREEHDPYTPANTANPRTREPFHLTRDPVKRQVQEREHEEVIKANRLSHIVQKKVTRPEPFIPKTINTMKGSGITEYPGQLLKENLIKQYNKKKNILDKFKRVYEDSDRLRELVRRAKKSIK